MCCGVDCSCFLLCLGEQCALALMLFLAVLARVSAGVAYYDGSIVFLCAWVQVALTQAQLFLGVLG